MGSPSMRPSMWPTGGDPPPGWRRWPCRTTRPSGPWRHWRTGISIFWSSCGWAQNKSKIVNLASARRSFPRQIQVHLGNTTFPARLILQLKTTLMSWLPFQPQKNPCNLPLAYGFKTNFWFANVIGLEDFGQHCSRSNLQKKHEGKGKV